MKTSLFAPTINEQRVEKVKYYFLKKLKSKKPLGLLKMEENSDKIIISLERNYPEFHIEIVLQNDNKITGRCLKDLYKNKHLHEFYTFCIYNERTLRKEIFILNLFLKL